MNRTNTCCCGRAWGCWPCWSLAAVQENFSSSGGKFRRRHAATPARSTSICGRSWCRNWTSPTAASRATSAWRPASRGFRGSRVVALHPPVVHDPAEFGCTVCHGGQGRATDKPDAHGDVPFWPRADDSAAVCLRRLRHLSHPSPRAEPDGAAARRRTSWSDTTAWPAIASTAAAARSAPAARAAWKARTCPASGWPATTPTGTKSILHTTKQADRRPLESFLRPDRRTGPRGDRRVPCLADRGAPKLVEAKALFHSLGCRGCHKVGGVGGERRPRPDAAKARKTRAGSISRTCRANRRWPTGWPRTSATRRKSCPARRCRARTERRADRLVDVLHAVAAAEQFPGGLLAEGSHPCRTIRRARVRHRRRDAVRHVLRRLSRRDGRRADGIPGARRSRRSATPIFWPWPATNSLPKRFAEAGPGGGCRPGVKQRAACGPRKSRN